LRSDGGFRGKRFVFGCERPGLAREVYGDSHGDVFDVSYFSHPGGRKELQSPLVISSVRQGGVIIYKGFRNDGWMLWNRG